MDSTLKQIYYNYFEKNERDFVKLIEIVGKHGLVALENSIKNLLEVCPTSITIDKIEFICSRKDDPKIIYLEDIKSYAKSLKLDVIKSDIDIAIQDANSNNLTYEEFLYGLLQKELKSTKNLRSYQNKLSKYDLVILDEFGYISADKEGAELLFTHISLRAGQKSTIITTNLSFDRWDEIFGYPIMTAAMTVFGGKVFN